MNLQEKLAQSREFLRSLAQGHGPARVAVAWTGGKDSTVALALWREIVAAQDPSVQVCAVSLDTGFKFPEIVAFRDHWAAEWNIHLTVVRPAPGDVPAVVARNKMACCRSLKIDPLKRAVRELGLAALITGLRADESASRESVAPLEARRDPDYFQANPILAWTEMDVWSHTLAAGIPYCELYDRGYRSLGCMPCTTTSGPGQDERSGRDPEKEGRMADLRALGYF